KGLDQVFAIVAVVECARAEEEGHGRIDRGVLRIIPDDLETSAAESDGLVPGSRKFQSAQHLRDVACGSCLALFALFSLSCSGGEGWGEEATVPTNVCCADEEVGHDSGGFGRQKNGSRLLVEMELSTLTGVRFGDEIAS